MKRSTKIMATILLVGGVLGLGGWWLYLAFTTRLVAGPMVQMVGPSGFTVVWQTNHPGRGHLHVFDQNGSVADVEASFEDEQYEATVCNLKPGRPYRYHITQSDHWAEKTLGGPWSCRTDSGRTGSFRMLAFGDSGMASFSQYKLADKMVVEKADVVIHTGDLVYPMGTPQLYPDAFYGAYPDMIASAPFMPVIGNHDYQVEGGRPMLRAFVLPRNGPTGTDPERHYWFDYGCARFAAIDSDVDEAELQDKVAPWLKTVFGNAADLWRFVYFHHPPYTGAAKHLPDKKTKRTLVPVMEELGVDLVFNGHNHLYERTHPLRGDQIVDDAQGIIYIVTGAGGANRYAMQAPASRPAYVHAYFDADFSFTIADVAPRSFACKQIDLKGRVVDRWELRRGPRASLCPATTTATTTTATSTPAR